MKRSTRPGSIPSGLAPMAASCSAATASRDRSPPCWDVERGRARRAGRKNRLPIPRSKRCRFKDNPWPRLNVGQFLQFSMVHVGYVL